MISMIEKLVENVDRAMQAEPVRRKTDDGEKEVTGEYVYNGSVANKALELIGKELGMFIDRKVVRRACDCWLGSIPFLRGSMFEIEAR